MIRISYFTDVENLKNIMQIPQLKELSESINYENIGEILIDLDNLLVDDPEKATEFKNSMLAVAALTLINYLQRTQNEQVGKVEEVKGE